MHSTISDGSDTIVRLIEIAVDKELDAIAITEHDTLSHAALIPPHSGIQVIAGVEISAVHRKTHTRTHVLGYNIKKPEIITALTQQILEARNRNSEKQADILIRAGFQIDMSKIARADGKYLYKQHIMDWLVTTGQVPEMFGGFYRRTFKQGGICDFDIEYTDVFDAVRAIKESGGTAVLAHPGQQENFWLIPELVKAGLEGLEFNHHSHNKEHKQTILDYATQYHLFLTGGSDYHGKYEPQPFGIGDFLSEMSGVKEIC
jgi:predicted metal-dependent phosphoesterase TrpH